MDYGEKIANWFIVCRNPPLAQLCGCESADQEEDLGGQQASEETISISEKGSEDLLYIFCFYFIFLITKDKSFLFSSIKDRDVNLLNFHDHL